MIGLVIILLFVLILPFFVKKVEHNLEIFLFIMGLAASIISGMMDSHLIQKALIDPIHITLGFCCRLGLQMVSATNRKIYSMGQ